MGRPSKPWYHADRDAWYTRIDGKWHQLAKGKKNRAAATRAFHELQVARGKAARTAGTISVAELVDRFLDWTKEHRSAPTYEFYQRHLSAFIDHVGRARPSGDVRAFHVTEWLDVQTWKQSTRHGAITSCKRCWRWGQRQGYLEINHLDGLDRPGMSRREAILSPKEEVAILLAAPDRLRDYLWFMRETGCRPSEVERMEASHVDLVAGVARMTSKTTRVTGRTRVIYLTARAAAIVGRLCAAHPNGPIFLNSKRTPWNRHSLAWAMSRLRKRIKMDSRCTAESFRHGWVTDAKLKLPNSVVAELAGHTSTAMVDRHYGHLNERTSELSAAASVVRDASASKVRAPSTSPAPPEPSEGDDTIQPG